MIYSNCLNTNSTTISTINYFLDFEMNYQVHSHHSRNSNKFRIKKVNHTFAKKCLRYSNTIIIVSFLHSMKINQAPQIFVMHNVNGFINYVKRYSLLNYCTYLYH